MRRFATLLWGSWLLVTPLAAEAEDAVGYRGWGPRLGASVNPDQIVFGGHLDFGHFAGHIRLQPNVEVGLGDHQTWVSFNGDLAYTFNTDWGRWSPYLGGGLNLNVVDYEPPIGKHQSDTDLGISALCGIQKLLGGGDRFFLEAKLGLVDAPDLKVLAGWTFYSRHR